MRCRLHAGLGGTALRALLHDAAEAYVGDVIRPLKIELPRFSEIEELWQKAIRLAFGVSNTGFDTSPIKRANSRSGTIHAPFRGAQELMQTLAVSNCMGCDESI
jgi:hypothetical protein